MNNEQNVVEVQFTPRDNEMVAKLEAMAAELGISCEDVVMMAIDQHLAVSVMRSYLTLSLRQRL